jgi:hypothetical protein
MKNKNFHKLIKAVVMAGAFALIFTACDNTYGVFHEIQTEKAQVGTDVFKNVTVKAIAEDATNYYAAMAKVFYKPLAGGLWLVLPVGSANDSDYFCAGLASDGAGALYVAAADANDTSLKGIFKTTDSGANWTTLDKTGLGTKIVDALYFAGDTLFVVAHTDAGTGSTYDLLYWNGTAFATTGLSNLDAPLLGVVKNASTYWAITAAKAYKGTTPAALTTDSTPTGGKTFTGLAVDSSNNILVTTSDGYLYTYSSGWTSVVVSADVALGVLAEMPASPTENRLIMGKYNSGYGYYEYVVAPPARYNGNEANTSAFVPTASSYTTTVYTKPVRALYYSSATKTLFIGLAAQGTDTYALYYNTYDPAAGTAPYWSGWKAE